MTQSVSPLKRALSHPRTLSIAMSLWPPFLASGVRVEPFAEDFTSVKVRLNRRPWNTNYVGTAFGGSLFAMSDPWWMFLVMQQLGSSYTVWDTAGEIEFVAPGRGTVYGTFEATPEEIDRIREQAAGGDKVLTWFSTDLTDGDGKTIARVRKQVYVRRKKR